MGRTEKIKEWLNSLDSDKIISLWNEYCGETDNNMDDYIYTNDDSFFDEMFSTKGDAVRAVCYGEYQYGDSYVVFNGYGNLDTFDYWDDENSPIDLSSIADWLDENNGYEWLSDEDGYDEIFNNED